MRKIYAIYFKSKPLDIFIIISYDYLKEYNKINLHEINFFKNKNDAVEYVKGEDLELVEISHTSTRTKINDLIGSINNYLSGENINLFDKISDLDIELGLQEKFPTSFSQDVIKNIIDLKRGEITTYSKIGDKIGSKAYRAIGNVCKSNPIPLIIPCHRVLRKNGEIGGFMGKADKTWETNLKKQLLKIEGYSI